MKKSKKELLVLSNELENLVLQKEINKACEDPWFFMTRFVYTFDPHDQKQPIKKFPDIPYLKELTEIILKEPLVLIEKSRQMLITWLCVGLFLWERIREPGYTFFQSKKEADAGLASPLSLLSRVKFIYEHLPEGKLKPIMEYSKIPPIIKFPEKNSVIHAVSQDSDALRQYTASRIFADEMAFQERAELAYMASKPTIDGGGKFCGVSTPNGKEFFYRLVKDLE